MNIYVSKISNIALDSKYTHWYLRLIEAAKIKGQDRKEAKRKYGYVEAHHILPKCFGLGGEKDKENLVFLTSREHFVAHQLLTKMFDCPLRRRKMLAAFGSMARISSSNYGRKLTSRQAQLAKAAFAESRKGKLNLSEETREKMRIRSQKRRKLKDQPHLKWCNTCKRGLPFDQFYSSKNRKDGKAGICRECKTEIRNGQDKDALAEYKKDYYKKNIAAHKERMSIYATENRQALSIKNWERKNGISFSDYENLFSSQRGACKLCDRTSRYRLCHVDAGLFCRECKKEGRI